MTIDTAPTLEPPRTSPPAPGPRRRWVTPVAVVVALAVGLGLGGLLFARTVVERDDANAAADPEEGQAPTTPSTGALEGDAPAAGGSVDRSPGAGGGDGADPVPAESLDPGQLRVVEPANAPTYAYQEADRGRTSTGTVPPPTLPVRVSMTSLEAVADGTPVQFLVEALDGSKVYNVDARICRSDARFSGQYDFFPTVTAKCAAEPLSAVSDAFVRVATDPPHTSAAGTFRVGTGTNAFVLDTTGERASITCDRSNPCKLVLWIQVPFGYGFQEFPISYA